MPVTPRDYAKKFHELEVLIYTDKQAEEAKNGALPAGSAWQTVNLMQYLLWDFTKTLKAQHEKNLAEFKDKVRPHIDQKGEKITVWVKTTAGDVVSKTYSSRGEIAENINDPFYGKGNPEEVQIVLQLAVRYGLIKAENLQTYCDNKLGLDCTGFVGNYLRHVVQNKPWDTDFHAAKGKKTEIDANSMIELIMSFQGSTEPVTTMEGIKLNKASSFLLALSNDHARVSDHISNGDGTSSVGHIVISEPSSLTTTPSFKLGKKEFKDVLTLTVLESTGGKGLVESPYLIVDVNKFGAFTVHRGSKGTDVTMKIVRLL